jgi:vitamin B12 transporter
MSVPRFFRSVVFCVLSLILAVASGDAQDSSPTQTPPLRHDVVVTATRLETPLREVASAVTVLTRTDLERTKKTTVLDVLRDTIGLAVVRNGGPGSASSVLIRGANSEHVLILLDGVPLNDPINPSRSFDLAHLTLDGIERVEILRGPQSTLFGSDALGGVINILTARGAGKPALSLRASGGSYGSFVGGADVRGSSGPIHYAFGLSRESTTGVSAASTGYPGNSEKDGYRNWTLAGRAGLALSGGTEIDLIVRGVSARTDIDAFGGPYGDDPNSVQQYSSGFARAQARTLFAGGRGESKFGFSYIRSSRDNDNPVDPAHPSDSETGRFRSSRARLDWQNNLFVQEAHTLSLGAELERETGESNYLSESAFGPYESIFPGRRADRAGIYLQDQFHFGGAFFATAGLRLDVHSRTGTSLTYRFAPAYIIERTGTKLKATIGTAFKSPSLYQLFAPGTFWGPIGNMSLSPEESLGWDAGVEQTLAAGTVLLGAVYFRSDFRNLIDFDFARGYINIGRARTSGWEISAEARPVDGLTVRGGYTRLSARDLSTDAPLLRRPKDKFSGSIQWAFAESWDAGLSAVYTGARTDKDFSGWTAPIVTLPAYTLVDAFVSFKPGAGLEIYGRLDNIMNARYETVFGYGTLGFAISTGLKLRI